MEPYRILLEPCWSPIEFLRGGLRCQEVMFRKINVNYSTLLHSEEVAATTNICSQQKSADSLASSNLAELEFVEWLKKSQLQKRG